MKYEIRKRSTTNPDIWYEVAWADTREWAGKIADALNLCGDGEFKFEEKRRFQT